MLTWTARGAVSEPTCLQVRVGPAYAGRVAAGAPLPGRALTADELSRNIRWFAVDRAGPRAPACTSLVLSGLDEVDPEAVLPVLARARAWGMSRITVHGGEVRADRPAAGADPALVVAAACDALVVRVSRADAVPALSRLTALSAAAEAGSGESAPAAASSLPRGPGGVGVVVLLTAEVLPALTDLAEALARARPLQVVFTWPFPSPDAGPPPPAPLAAEAVRGPVRVLAGAGVRVGVKGLPLCTLAPGPAAGVWEDHVWRSANRWYVDEGHQLRDAMLFFPDVVRFAKPEGCRFCSATTRCDGVVEAWLRQGLAGPLTPLHGPDDR